MTRTVRDIVSAISGVPFAGATFLVYQSATPKKPEVECVQPVGPGAIGELVGLTRQNQDVYVSIHLTPETGVEAARCSASIQTKALGVALNVFGFSETCEKAAADALQKYKAYMIPMEVK